MRTITVKIKRNSLSNFSWCDFLTLKPQAMEQKTVTLQLFMKNGSPQSESWDPEAINN
jgi:hypothetical protein